MFLFYKWAGIRPSWGSPTFIPMGDAARRAYEAMREANGRLLTLTEGLVAEGVGVSSRLAACADELRARGLDVYGEQPPSRLREKITGDVTGDDFLEFSEDANSLVKFIGEPNAAWVNLVVKERELRPHLKNIRSGKTTVSGLPIPSSARPSAGQPVSEWWLDKLAANKAERSRILIGDAARQIYTAIQELPAGEEADKFAGNDPESRLLYCVYIILSRDPPYDLRGTKPPADTPISLKGMALSPVPGTNNLRSKNHPGQLFVDVTISRADLERHIEYLKTLGVPDEPPRRP